VAGAYLDARLRQLLVSHFINDPKIAEGLVGQAGSIGSFSSRIDLAYLLGLIGPEARREVHLVRGIRNEFGHNPQQLTFTAPEISNRCRELTRHQVSTGRAPRSDFTRTVMGILAVIDARIIKERHRLRGKDIQVTDSQKSLFLLQMAKMDRMIKSSHKGRCLSQEEKELKREIVESLLETIAGFDRNVERKK
jgi:DNA-binding MltR family transcriptional regulator